jgi:2-hydroxy-6-oxonona-2,4-dienedioate hydrolase
MTAAMKLQSETATSKFVSIGEGAGELRLHYTTPATATRRS